MEDKHSETFWSLENYRDYECTRSHFTDMRSNVINVLIALAFILSFIGFIIFPQILIPGTLLLSACLIGAQALASFAILATISKFLFTIYERGGERTLQMMIFGPVDLFDKHPLAATLLALGFLGIFIVIILSGTGVITVPFLTVFAANSLSLEIEEIILGLLSDIAVVSVGAMLCYLPSFLKERWNLWWAEPVIISAEDENTQPTLQEAAYIHITQKENSLNNEDPLKKSTERELTEKEEEHLKRNFCNLL